MIPIRHALQQPFITATGIAAFIHSTWTLGTLFGGLPPQMALNLAFLYWIIPAMLIAFALDVGQIMTSVEIRAGARTRAKYITFTVFAVANYFLQWLYMAHHMPALELATGVREQWQPVTQLIRDASLWVIPSFLPLSTLLYTLSDNHQPALAQAAFSDGHEVVSIHPSRALLLDDTQPTPLDSSMTFHDVVIEDLGVPSNSEAANVVTCSDCGWSGSYDTQKSAAAGLRAHKLSHSKRNAKGVNAAG